MRKTPQQQRELERQAAWKIKRLEIFKRDGLKCFNCGKKRGLSVHHLFNRGYRSLFLDERFLCVLGICCHGDFANTEAFKRRIVKKIKAAYHYVYEPKYDYLFEEEGK